MKISANFVHFGDSEMCEKWRIPDFAHFFESEIAPGLGPQNSEMRKYFYKRSFFTWSDASGLCALRFASSNSHGNPSNGCSTLIPIFDKKVTWRYQLQRDASYWKFAKVLQNRGMFEQRGLQEMIFMSTVADRVVEWATVTPGSYGSLFGMMMWFGLDACLNSSYC